MIELNLVWSFAEDWLYQMTEVAEATIERKGWKKGPRLAIGNIPLYQSNEVRDAVLL